MIITGCDAGETKKSLSNMGHRVLPLKIQPVKCLLYEITTIHWTLKRRMHTHQQYSNEMCT